MPEQTSFTTWLNNHIYFNGWTTEGDYTIATLARLMGAGKRTVAYWVAHKRCPAWAEDKITALAEQGAFDKKEKEANGHA